MNPHSRPAPVLTSHHGGQCPCSPLRCKQWQGEQQVAASRRASLLDKATQYLEYLRGHPGQPDVHLLWREAQKKIHEYEHLRPPPARPAVPGSGSAVARPGGAPSLSRAPKWAPTRVTIDNVSPLKDAVDRLRVFFIRGPGAALPAQARAAPPGQQARLTQTQRTQLRRQRSTERTDRDARLLEIMEESLQLQREQSWRQQNLAHGLAMLVEHMLRDTPDGGVALEAAQSRRPIAAACALAVTAQLAPSQPLVGQAAALASTTARASMNVGPCYHVPLDPVGDPYQHVRSSPALLRGLTNFEPAEFQRLHQLLQSAIAAPLDVRGERGDAPRGIGGRRRAVTTETELVLFLQRLKSRQPVAYAVSQAGWSQGSISASFYNVLRAVLTCPELQITWPGPAQRAQLASLAPTAPSGQHIIGAWDGTQCPIQRPRGQVDEADYYNGRTHQYCMNNQAAVLLNGCFMAVYEGYSGHTHDSDAAQGCPPLQHWDDFFSPGETLVADSAYTATPFLTPATGRGLSAAQMTCNRFIARHRVVVEFAFGALKRKFAIVREEWQQPASLNMQPFVFRACCQLLNYWFSCYGPLRGEMYARQGMEHWEQELERQHGPGLWALEGAALTAAVEECESAFATVEIRGVAV